MEAIYYLKLLKNEFHSTVFATVDENGRPVTCVIDIMRVDREGLDFLTAKGKAFYSRLKRRPFVSLTGLKGEDTMSSKSIALWRFAPNRPLKGEGYDTAGTASFFNSVLN